MKISEFKRDYLPIIAKYKDFVGLFDQQKISVKKESDTFIIISKNIYVGFIEIVWKERINVILTATEAEDTAPTLDIEITFFGKNFDSNVRFYQMDLNTKKIKYIKAFM